jgi:hypothetical protein
VRIYLRTVFAVFSVAAFFEADRHVFMNALRSSPFSDFSLASALQARIRSCCGFADAGALDSAAARTMDAMLNSFITDSFYENDIDVA